MQQGRAAASPAEVTGRQIRATTPHRLQLRTWSTPLSVVHSTGRVYDAAAVGRVTRRHNVPYLLDACQSVGQVHTHFRIELVALE